MHQTPNIHKLYEPKLYYENPNVQAFSKLQGIIKKKKEKSMVGGMINPGSSKKFFKFYSKGQILVYYDDCPPKPESRPKLVIYIQEIKDMQMAFKGKVDHLKITLPNKEIELKFSSVKEMNIWCQAIDFLRDFYKNTVLNRVRNYKEDIDVETMVDIIAENEVEKWETVKQKFDYTSFFKDKKLEELFMLFPLGKLSNRILLGHLRKKTKWKKDALKSQIGDETAQIKNSNFSGGISPGLISTPGLSPSTPNGTRQGRMKFFDQMNTFGSKPYLGFLISQSSLNRIDEDQFLKDAKAITKPVCLAGFEFNTIYLYDYSGPGDTRAFHKMITIKFAKK